MKPQGFDLEALLRSGPMVRLRELYCLASVVLNAVWCEMMVVRVVSGRYWWE